MLAFTRGISILVLFAGLALASRPQPVHAPTGPSANSIPYPVCPPNDPNACHIDTWPN